MGQVDTFDGNFSSVMSSRLLSLLARRGVSTGGTALSSSTSGKVPPQAEKAAASRMTQVEVDEAHVQQQLGQMQMDFVRRAERANEERANKHRKFRRGDTMIGGEKQQMYYYSTRKEL